MQGAELAYIHLTRVQHHTTQGDVSKCSEHRINKMVKLGSKVHRMLKITQISSDDLVNVNVQDSVSPPQLTLTCFQELMALTENNVENLVFPPLT